jgi:hypothetical protein
MLVSQVGDRDRVFPGQPVPGWEHCDPRFG